jgi:hypothetical protein
MYLLKKDIKCIKYDQLTVEDFPVDPWSVYWRLAVLCADRWGEHGVFQ